MTDPRMAQVLAPYQPKHHVRFVTAAALFDGHDAAINIMRRLLQNTGCEVIHLGHNRSAAEIVRAALQEDVQGIAVTSYQGGTSSFSNTWSISCARTAASGSRSSAVGAG